jgi:Ca-activated chloride channel family protein
MARTLAADHLANVFRKHLILKAISTLAGATALLLPAACTDAAEFGEEADSDGSGGEPSDSAPPPDAGSPARSPSGRTQAITLAGLRPPAPALVRDAAARPTQGRLLVARGAETWELPLVHSDVDARISAHLADVELTQVFGNPWGDPIEAVYLFPLPDDAAVDAMTLRVGDRVVEGAIHRREQARAIYDAARRAGQTAALLDQERPNVFTQHVANVMPGEAVAVTIHFVDPLAYEDGGYEWAFPLVVGPRYVPPWGTGNSGGAPSVAEDAAILDAPVSPQRTGNDVSIRVHVDAGVRILDVDSPSHDVEVERPGPSLARVHTPPHERIPNKDFILRWEVAGDAPQSAVLAHRAEPREPGYFMLVVQPPAEEGLSQRDVTPKEMVFVVDTSCSMSGWPLEKAKELMQHAIAGMNPDDRFLVLDFDDSVSSLAPYPLPNSAENRRRGADFVRGFQGGGGTNMLAGIRASLDLPAEREVLRTVLFLTDGYIGNEDEILANIEQRLGRTRLYSLGVGTSVNRYLLDRMAKLGRGTVQYLRPDEDAGPAVREFYERIRNPLWTDIELDWDGVDVDVAGAFPDPIPDLFSGQPLVLVGRYSRPGKGFLTVRGCVRGRPREMRVPVELPEWDEAHASLRALWARSVVEDLEGRQRGREVPEIAEEITQVALRHGLMTRYTSFVAVERRVVNESGGAERVDVPLETPEMVDWEAATGAAEGAKQYRRETVQFGGGAGGSQIQGSVRKPELGYMLPAPSPAEPAASPAKAAPSGSSAATAGSSAGDAGGIGGLGTRGSGLADSGYGRGSGFYGEKGGPGRSVGAGDPVILGALDKSAIDRVVRQHLASIRYCYEKELTNSPALFGKIVIRFTIGADGSVSAAELTSTTMASEAVEGCVVERFLRMRFPAPQGGGIVIVSYPFVFNGTAKEPAGPAE